MKKLSSSKFKKILAIAGIVMIIGCMFCTGAFADPATPVAVSEPTYQEAAKEVFDSVHGVVNFNNILSIIGVALTAEATLFLLWWGIRKVIKLVKSGLNGKLKA